MEIKPDKTLEEKALDAELFTCFEGYFKDNDYQYLEEAIDIIKSILKLQDYPMSRG